MKLVSNSIIFFWLVQQISFAQVVGVRRAEEYLSTLESLTGTSRLEAGVKAFYSSFSLSLPQNGKMEEYNATTILTSIGLASEFCLGMIERDRSVAPANSWAHRTVDMTKDVLLWEKKEIALLLVEYAEVFWGRELEERELQSLSFIFETFRSGSPIKTSETTLVGTCALMLALPYVLIK